MGFSGAVQWWEEWQLRVLVLASLFLQYFLFVAAPLRKRCIPALFRFVIWLAYLGSDAVAIYALAALFNRHKGEWASTHRESANVEALWAPILLVHLGGQDGIVAYNIEDNELWTRHALTAVSQITVAIYVFHKSWSGDKRLLQAAIIIFVIGIIKCLEKPWALRCASIRSLMKSNTSSSSRSSSGGRRVPETFDERQDKLYKLFVDIAPSGNLYWDTDPLGDTHDTLRAGLSWTFDRLYTKEQVKDNVAGGKDIGSLKRCWGKFLRTTILHLVFVPIALFHTSHRKSYDGVDVKVTYTLLGCTAALELMALLLPVFSYASSMMYGFPWPDRVAQYNLIGYLARNRKHRWLRRRLLLRVCKDFLDHLWCMKPCKSSRDITDLVKGYLKDGQEHHMADAAAAMAFNDSRGQRTLRGEWPGGGGGGGDHGGIKNLERSLRAPFDESVLLWHLATDLCFYGDGTGTSAAAREAARRSRVMSNYMAYLLFVNPEMLMTGARPSLFRDAYEELKRILVMKQDRNQPGAALHQLPMLDAEEGEPARDHTAAPGKKEEELAGKIIHKLKGGGLQGGGVVHGAWALSRDLVDLCRGDEEKMWRVIQGVWVEMLCFSAGRCRGYLHAKSLGKGGEYLSYVWLLADMGMETLAQRMQRTDLQEEGGSNGGAADCTARASAAATATIIGDGNEMTQLHEEGDRNGGAGCTRTTTDNDEKRDCDGGSHRTTSAAPTTPAAATTIIGDENV